MKKEAPVLVLQICRLVLQICCSVPFFPTANLCQNNGYIPPPKNMKILAIDASLVAWFIDDTTIHILAEKVADDAELSLIANVILNFPRYNPGSDTKEVSESVSRFWKNKEFIRELHNTVMEENQFLILDLLDRAREFTEEPVENRVPRINKDCLSKKFRRSKDLLVK